MLRSSFSAKCSISENELSLINKAVSFAKNLSVVNKELGRLLIYYENNKSPKMELRDTPILIFSQL